MCICQNNGRIKKLWLFCSVMMMKNDSGTCGIYKITRKDTGQSYIGLSENIEKRYRQHANGHDIEHSRIDRAMVKHGEDKFDLKIIEELPNDRPLLMEHEEYWVAYYNTYEDDFHYNLTPGGDFCPMKVPEIAKKISEAVSGKNHYMYGKKLPEDTRKKISKSMSGKNHPMYGKKHTPETKEKISKAKSGNKHTLETREKMSKAKSGENNPLYGKRGKESPRFGCKHTSETKEKMSKAKSGENNPMYGKKHTPEVKVKMSSFKNTTGYFHVSKAKTHKYKQGFYYRYQYCNDDGKRHAISSVSLEKLEQKVKDKGLPWFKLE